MSIEEKLNKLYEESKRIDGELSSIKKKINQLKRIMRRAKSEASKEAIKDNDIKPLVKQAKKLERENKKIELQTIVIENYVINEELETRKNNNTVTNIDNKFTNKLRFIFSSLRRFGNFTGYLGGRLEETEDYLKNQAIKFITDDKFADIIESKRMDEIAEKKGIEIKGKKKKEIRKELYEILISEIPEEDINKSVLAIKKGVIGKVGEIEKSDRKELFTKFIKSGISNKGKGPNNELEIWEASKEEQDELEQ